jgi:hypothetical protein
MKEDETRSFSDLDVEELNARHTRNIDKFFRSSAGAASEITRFHDGYIYLEIKLDDRAQSPIEALIRNIALSWRREKQLANADGYCASLYFTPRRSGYLLKPDATPADRAEAERRMREPANQPDVFLKMIEEPFGFELSSEALQVL